MEKIILTVALIIFLLPACSKKRNEYSGQSLYSDELFLQDYSIKYFSAVPGAKFLKVVTDRNGYIQIHSTAGLLKPAGGMFQNPGTLVTDNHYRYLSTINISAIGIYNNQIIYCDKKNIFSNAWAGKLFIEHELPGARLFAGGRDFTFLVSDGSILVLLTNSGILWKDCFKEETIKDIKYSDKTRKFYILGDSSIFSFSPGEKKMEKIFSCSGLTCFEITPSSVIAGTTDGFIKIDINTGRPTGEIFRNMPCKKITVVREINGNLWFGSDRGAMMFTDEGKFNYYASERWLPSDTVVDISEGPDCSVLVLTNRGLARICFTEMSLNEKAIFFEKQVRKRHIRNGFNATLVLTTAGDLSTGSLEDSDNDGLWTGLYLAAEVFRYAVTRSAEALQNVRESLDAMERLYNINPVPGFPARSFERKGFYRYDPDRWLPSEDPGWYWKSTTSSDEAIGHIFAFGVTAELIDDAGIKNKAVMLIDTLMSHIVKNNFYLVDYDGKPTRWGRWNPEYVNALHPSTGDRKLNSSNIIAMLQTAYHFTGKEKYRNAAFYLMNEHGYLINLMRPMNEIGTAPPGSDPLSRILSDSWNHSDDEMYFCGYWGLYRYAFNDTLKEKYKQSILDHWQAERPEKEGLWNIMTYLTGEKNCDLKEALWYLREYPLDLITWTIKNSHRNDILVIAENFRNQTISEVLPPDELPVSRHNTNRFVIDGGNGGLSEMSAGDIWLLPYWMARYLGVISGPVKQSEKNTKLCEIRN